MNSSALILSMVKSVQDKICFTKHQWRLRSGALWIPAWDCCKMPPVKQEQSWDFHATKYSAVKCQGKQLEMTAPPPWSERSRSLTERDQGMMRHRAQRSPTFCRVSHHRPSKFMWPSDQLKIRCLKSFKEWASTAKQLHPSLQQEQCEDVGCSDIKQCFTTLVPEYSFFLCQHTFK